MMLLGGGGDGDGGGVVGSSGATTAHQEGRGDNLVVSDDNNNNNSLDGVRFGEEENISNNNNGRNGNNMEDGDRNNSAGSRWPRQETLALLKIRSDMDVAFRDSNLKGPLWDDVSRKMGELGYHRSAKKCKEKFENVYKYHKRTKDGRSSKSDGKTYRFFDQLEALDQLQPFRMLMPPAQQQHQVVVDHSKGIMPFQLPPPAPATISFGQQQPCNNSNTNTVAPVAKNPTNTISPKFQSGTTTNNFMVSTSSSTSSDDFQRQRTSGKKRKWKDFFEKLMRDVVDKQEELQTKFLRTIEMRERERCMREEAWRMQEMARLNREHEILVQERSAAAAKDAAVIAFLQKIAGQEAVVVPQKQQQQQPPPLHPIQQLIITPRAPSPPRQRQTKPVNVMKPEHYNNDLNNKMMVCSSSTSPPSSSRWPKAEVEALIKLRTSFEIKYQENGPKGPFWEEISAAMRNLGYNRNAKRCKEKWENINKYFKKVKESNKQRPEDSKTCPYYHLLDAIYKEKKCFNGGDFNYPPPLSSANSLMEPLMVQPEQQWPLAPQILASSHSQNPNTEADDDKEEQDDMLDEDELDQDMEDEEEGDNNNGSGTYEVVATASDNPQHGASATTTGSMETAVA